MKNSFPARLTERPFRLSPKAGASRLSRRIDNSFRISGCSSAWSRHYDARNHNSMCRIAIVDDSAVMRDAIKSLLASSPRWIVCEAASHPEALRVCQEVKPDLILIDLSLGSGSGLSTARALRQSVPGAKIIIMSAQDRALLAEMKGTFGFECVEKSDLADTLPALLAKIENGAREDPEPFSKNVTPR
jgi:CheY-like chemotaxis protein